MSKIASKIANSFKHPAEPSEEKAGAESSSAKRIDEQESQAGAAQTQQQVSNPSSTAASGGVSQQQTSAGHGQHPIGRESHGVPHIEEKLEQTIPTTGYVGDDTSGRFPGQPKTGSSGTAGGTTSQASTPSSASSTGTSGVGSGASSSDKGSRAGNELPGGPTGREGVPGTTVGGDPSMGGKGTNAQT